jgi:hypothetical protein
MPEPTHESEWRRIVDPDAVRFLMDGSQRRYLGPFLRNESTVAQAAAELAVGTDDMYYRVKRMQRFGILSVTRSEPRAGRPVKYYSAGPHALFVPFAATDYDTVEAMLLATEAANQAWFTRNLAVSLARRDAADGPPWGCLIYADTERVMHYRMRQEGATTEAAARNALLDPDAPATYSVWRGLRLRWDDGKELQARMDDLVQEFEQRAAALEGATDVRRYFLRLALTPLADD